MVDGREDGVVPWLAPVCQQLVAGVVGRHGGGQQYRLVVTVVPIALRPVVSVAQARVKHHDTVALTVFAVIESVQLEPEAHEHI